jgi:hypothetical protein
VPKNYEELPPITVDRIFAELSHQLGDGARMWALRRLLKPRE